MTWSPGSLLYRATWDEGDWRTGVRWFTDNAQTAAMYLTAEADDDELAALPWAIVRVRVVAPMTLAALPTWRALDRLARWAGMPDARDVSPKEAGAYVCGAGVSGWHLYDGDFGGEDVLLCDPARHLALDRVLARGPGAPPDPDHFSDPEWHP